MVGIGRFQDLLFYFLLLIDCLRREMLLPDAGGGSCLSIAAACAAPPSPGAHLGWFGLLVTLLLMAGGSTLQGSCMSLLH